MSAPDRVYKYPLPLESFGPFAWMSLEMPQGAVPLCVQVQRGVPCLWARVNPSAPVTVHNLRIAGTGEDLESDVGRHLGTVQLDGGSLVLHVFAYAEAQA